MRRQRNGIGLATLRQGIAPFSTSIESRLTRVNLRMNHSSCSDYISGDGMSSKRIVSLATVLPIAPSACPGSLRAQSRSTSKSYPGELEPSAVGDLETGGSAGVERAILNEPSR